MICDPLVCCEFVFIYFFFFFQFVVLSFEEEKGLGRIGQNPKSLQHNFPKTVKSTTKIFTSCLSVLVLVSKEFQHSFFSIQLLNGFKVLLFKVLYCCRTFECGKSNSIATFYSSIYIYNQPKSSQEPFSNSNFRVQIMFRTFDLSLFFKKVEFKIEMAKIKTFNLNEDPNPRL